MFLFPVTSRHVRPTMWSLLRVFGLDKSHTVVSEGLCKPLPTLINSQQKTKSQILLEQNHHLFPSGNRTIMQDQPDHRRLTMWERLSTRHPRTQRRWSTPTQPKASLIQPGYTDLGPRPPRPLRAPAYPLSSRPFLDQQTSTQRKSSQNTSSQQKSQQISPQKIPPRQISPQSFSQEAPSQPGTRLWNRVRRLSRLFRPSRQDHSPAQASPPASPSSPPIIVSPIISPQVSDAAASPVALENPRRAPLPPPHAHKAHAPANRRPLSVPAPLRGAPDPPMGEAEPETGQLPPRASLQLSQFALCHACSRVRHCMVGLGGGRVLCNECLRKHFID